MQVLASDIKVIFLGCVLSKLSLIGNLSQEIEFLRNIEQKSETLIKEILAQQLPLINGNEAAQQTLQADQPPPAFSTTLCQQRLW
jgi:hypothetical protein